MLTFETTSPEAPEAVGLVEELSATLARITGADGRASFDVAEMRNPRAVFLVGWMEGKPVACGAFRPIDDSTCEIKRMFCRIPRRGLGRLILRELERRARALGYTRAILETRKVNTTAVAFYRRQGYSVIPNYGKYVGNDAAICFAKELAETPAA